MRTPTPSLRFHAPGPEADAAEGSLLRIGDPQFEPLYVVKGDQTFGVRLMVQATRELLVKLASVDGRIWAIHEGTVEITGPFMTNPRQLGEFLELSAQILDRIAAAALPAEAPR